MTRLNLTWSGSERGAGETRSCGTFGILVAISVVYFIIMNSIGWLQWLFVDSTGHITNETGYYVIDMAYLVFQLCFLIFLVVLVCKTRKHIRGKYNIREQSCQGCEDCCCAFWCSCCTLAQMARHTADYDTYAARCCSETGLPANVVSV
jgi:Cys-rich protein (TIGR01571 family)